MKEVLQYFAVTETPTLYDYIARMLKTKTVKLLKIKFRSFERHLHQARTIAVKRASVFNGLERVD